MGYRFGGHVYLNTKYIIAASNIHFMQNLNRPQDRYMIDVFCTIAKCYIKLP